MNDILPLFPLQLVAFPTEALNLHIFEPRYRQLIKECDTTEDMRFGIPAFIDGKLQVYGTEMQLLSIEKTYTDGKMDIKTKGVGVFRIKDFLDKLPEKLYTGGHVEYIENDSKNDILLSHQIVKKLEELYRIMEIRKTIPTVADFSTFEMGHHVGFTIEQEYELLKLTSELDRQEYMLAHLERLIPTLRQMEDLRKRVQMNGHFKDLIPPM